MCVCVCVCVPPTDAVHDVCPPTTPSIHPHSACNVSLVCVCPSPSQYMQCVLPTHPLQAVCLSVCVCPPTHPVHAVCVTHTSITGSVSECVCVPPYPPSTCSVSPHPPSVCNVPTYPVHAVCPPPPPHPVRAVCVLSVCVPPSTQCMQCVFLVYVLSACVPPPPSKCMQCVSLVCVSPTHPVYAMCTLSLSVRLHTVVTLSQTKRLQLVFTEHVACLVRPDDILGPAVASVPRSDNVFYTGRPPD